MFLTSMYLTFSVGKWNELMSDHPKILHLYQPNDSGVGEI